ncbi:ALG6, ALG8 glycosyltransferase [Serendipita vermifera]|nr:ALG6, ALG8 glycosyltransferase [Serendipita vermifera]
MSSPKHSKRLSLPVMPSGALRLKTKSIPPKTTLDSLQGQDPSKPTTIKELEAKASRDSRRFEWDLLIVGTALKLLLFPAYRSTDFEVHRNWMAITHSLPVSKWYFEKTSEWTLDYPPFFAYFEYLLSIPASLIDSKMVELNNLSYDSWSVIAYQRSTVIVSELVMALALRAFIPRSLHPRIQRILSASLFFHPGFLIVDHIHFQYNGFMFGILLWSILMAREDRKLLSGILFAVLLNFKHIYMYIAPAYFVYLLRSYCFTPTGSISFVNFASLAQAVLAVFAVSFGPFALMGQIPQVLSRLFPFTRGLNHAYWAPNVWALVTALDRVLLQVVKRFGLGLDVKQSGVESTSRGLVGDTSFAILPNIKPIHTFAITIVLQMIFLIKLWRNPTYKSFVTALTLCGYVSFLFGWHVHEKAILLVLVPLSLIAGDKHSYFRVFSIASVSGIFSLFPLLFTPAETLIKVVYSLVWCIFVLPPLSKQLYEFPTSLPGVLIDYLERAYFYGFVPLQVFTSLYPVLVGRLSNDPEDDTLSKLEFLPLMVTSIYCAIGVTWAFLRLSVLYLRKQF